MLGLCPRSSRGGKATVRGSIRLPCPFRELVDDHRELVCTLHRGLLEGMLAAVRPALQVREFRPFAERSICRLVASG